MADKSRTLDFFLRLVHEDGGAIPGFKGELNEIAKLAKVSGEKQKKALDEMFSGVRTVKLDEKGFIASASRMRDAINQMKVDLESAKPQFFTKDALKEFGVTRVQMGKALTAFGNEAARSFEGPMGRALDSISARFEKVLEIKDQGKFRVGYTKLQGRLMELSALAKGLGVNLETALNRAAGSNTAKNIQTLTLNTGDAVAKLRGIGGTAADIARATEKVKTLSTAVKNLQAASAPAARAKLSSFQNESLLDSLTEATSRLSKAQAELTRLQVAAGKTPETQLKKRTTLTENLTASTRELGVAARKANEIELERGNLYRSFERLAAVRQTLTEDELKKTGSRKPEKLLLAEQDVLRSAVALQKYGGTITDIVRQVRDPEKGFPALRGVFDEAGNFTLTSLTKQAEKGKNIVRQNYKDMTVTVEQGGGELRSRLKLVDKELAAAVDASGLSAAKRRELKNLEGLQRQIAAHAAVTPPKVIEPVFNKKKEQIGTLEKDNEDYLRLVKRLTETENKAKAIRAAAPVSNAAAQRVAALQEERTAIRSAIEANRQLVAREDAQLANIMRESRARRVAEIKKKTEQDVKDLQAGKGLGAVISPKRRAAAISAITADADLAIKAVQSERFWNTASLSPEEKSSLIGTMQKIDEARRVRQRVVKGLGKGVREIFTFTENMTETAARIEREGKVVSATEEWVKKIDTAGVLKGLKTYQALGRILGENAKKGGGVLKETGSAMLTVAQARADEIESIARQTAIDLKDNAHARARGTKKAKPIRDVIKEVMPKGLTEPIQQAMFESFSEGFRLRKGDLSRAVEAGIAGDTSIKPATAKAARSVAKQVEGTFSKEFAAKGFLVPKDLAGQINDQLGKTIKSGTMANVWKLQSLVKDAMQFNLPDQTGFKKTGEGITRFIDATASALKASGMRFDKSTSATVRTIAERITWVKDAITRGTKQAPPAEGKEFGSVLFEQSKKLLKGGQVVKDAAVKLRAGIENLFKTGAKLPSQKAFNVWANYALEDVVGDVPLAQLKALFKKVGAALYKERADFQKAQNAESARLKKESVKSQAILAAEKTALDAGATATQALAAMKKAAGKEGRSTLAAILKSREDGEKQAVRDAAAAAKRGGLGEEVFKSVTSKLYDSFSQLGKKGEISKKAMPKFMDQLQQSVRDIVLAKPVKDWEQGDVTRIVNGALNLGKFNQLQAKKAKALVKGLFRPTAEALAREQAGFADQVAAVGANQPRSDAATIKSVDAPLKTIEALAREQAKVAGLTKRQTDKYVRGLLAMDKEYDRAAAAKQKSDEAAARAASTAEKEGFRAAEIAKMRQQQAENARLNAIANEVNRAEKTKERAAIRERVRADLAAAKEREKAAKEEAKRVAAEDKRAQRGAKESARIERASLERQLAAAQVRDVLEGKRLAAEARKKSAKKAVVQPPPIVVAPPEIEVQRDTAKTRKVVEKATDAVVAETKKASAKVKKAASEKKPKVLPITAESVAAETNEVIAALKSGQELTKRQQEIWSNYIKKGGAASQPAAVPRSRVAGSDQKALSDMEQMYNRVKTLSFDRERITARLATGGVIPADRLFGFNVADVQNVATALLGTLGRAYGQIIAARDNFYRRMSAPAKGKQPLLITEGTATISALEKATTQALVKVNSSFDRVSQAWSTKWSKLQQQTLTMPRLEQPARKLLPEITEGTFASSGGKLLADLRQASRTVSEMLAKSRAGAKTGVGLTEDDLIRYGQARKLLAQVSEGLKRVQYDGKAAGLEMRDLGKGLIQFGSTVESGKGKRAKTSFIETSDLQRILPVIQQAKTMASILDGALDSVRAKIKANLGMDPSLTLAGKAAENKRSEAEQAQIEEKRLARRLAASKAQLEADERRILLGIRQKAVDEAQAKSAILLSQSEARQGKIDYGNALRAQILDLDQRFNQMSYRFQHMGWQLGLVGGVMVAGFASAMKAAQTLNKELTMTAAIMEANSDGSKSFAQFFDEAKKAALDWSTQTIFSASEVNKAMMALAQAGQSGKETQLLPQILDFAAAGGLELGDAVRSAVSAMTAFKLSAGEMGAVTNAMTVAAISTNAEVKDMADAFKHVGPIAAMAGMSIEETAAAVGRLSQAGIRGSMAGTGLKRAMSELMAPTGKAAKYLKALNIEAVDLSTGMLRSMPDIIDQFKMAFDRLGPAADKAGILMEIFGMRAGPAMVALVNEGSAGLRGLNEQILNQMGKQDEIAQRTYDSLSGHLTRLGNSITNFKAILGQQTDWGFFKTIIDAATSAVEAVTKLVDNSKGLQTVVTVVLALAAAFGSLALVGGSISMAVSGIFTLLSVVAMLAKGGGMQGFVATFKEMGLLFGANKKLLADQVVAMEAMTMTVGQLNKALAVSSIESLKNTEADLAAQIAKKELNLVTAKENTLLIEEIGLLKARRGEVVRQIAGAKSVIDGPSVVPVDTTKKTGSIFKSLANSIKTSFTSLLAIPMMLLFGKKGLGEGLEKVGEAAVVAAPKVGRIGGAFKLLGKAIPGAGTLLLLWSLYDVIKMVGGSLIDLFSGGEARKLDKIATSLEQFRNRFSKENKPLTIAELMGLKSDPEAMNQYENEVDNFVAYWEAKKSALDAEFEQRRTTLYVPAALREEMREAEKMLLMGKQAQGNVTRSLEHAAAAFGDRGAALEKINEMFGKGEDTSLGIKGLLGDRAKDLQDVLASYEEIQAASEELFRNEQSNATAATTSIEEYRDSIYGAVDAYSVMAALIKSTQGQEQAAAYIGANKQRLTAIYEEIIARERLAEAIDHTDTSYQAAAVKRVEDTGRARLGLVTQFMNGELAIINEISAKSGQADFENITEVKKLKQLIYTESLKTLRDYLSEAEKLERDYAKKSAAYQNDIIKAQTEAREMLREANTPNTDFLGDVDVDGLSTSIINAKRASDSFNDSLAHRNEYLRQGNIEEAKQAQQQVDAAQSSLTAIKKELASRIALSAFASKDAHYLYKLRAETSIGREMSKQIDIAQRLQGLSGSQRDAERLKIIKEIEETERTAAKARDDIAQQQFKANEELRAANKETITGLKEVMSMVRENIQLLAKLTGLSLFNAPTDDARAFNQELTDMVKLLEDAAKAGKLGEVLPKVKGKLGELGAGKSSLLPSKASIESAFKAYDAEVQAGKTAAIKAVEDVGKAEREMIETNSKLRLKAIEDARQAGIAAAGGKSPEGGATAAPAVAKAIEAPETQGAASRFGKAVARGMVNDLKGAGREVGEILGPTLKEVFTQPLTEARLTAAAFSEVGSALHESAVFLSGSIDRMGRQMADTLNHYSDLLEGKGGVSASRKQDIDQALGKGMTDLLSEVGVKVEGEFETGMLAAFSAVKAKFNQIVSDYAHGVIVTPADIKAAEDMEKKLARLITTLKNYKDALGKEKAGPPEFVGPMPTAATVAANSLFDEAKAKEQGHAWGSAMGVAMAAAAKDNFRGTFTTQDGQTAYIPFGEGIEKAAGKTAETISEFTKKAYESGSLKMETPEVGSALAKSLASGAIEAKPKITQQLVASADAAAQPMDAIFQNLARSAASRTGVYVEQYVDIAGGKVKVLVEQIGTGITSGVEEALLVATANLKYAQDNLKSDTGTVSSFAARMNEEALKTAREKYDLAYKAYQLEAASTGKPATIPKIVDAFAEQAAKPAAALGEAALAIQGVSSKTPDAIVSVSDKITDVNNSIPDAVTNIADRLNRMVGRPTTAKSTTPPPTEPPPTGNREGGPISGYGGGDTVPALLEPGEFVLRKEAVRKYGVGQIHALNAGNVERFAKGGQVGGDNESWFTILSKWSDKWGRSGAEVDAIVRSALAPAERRVISEGDPYMAQQISSDVNNVVGNAAKSLASMVYETVAHPVDQIAGMGKLAVGAFNALVPKGLEIPDHGGEAKAAFMQTFDPATLYKNLYANPFGPAMAVGAVGGVMEGGSALAGAAKRGAVLRVAEGGAGRLDLALAGKTKGGSPALVDAMGVVGDSAGKISRAIVSGDTPTMFKRLASVLDDVAPDLNETANVLRQAKDNKAAHGIAADTVIEMYNRVRSVIDEVKARSGNEGLARTPENQALIDRFYGAANNFAKVQETMMEGRRLFWSGQRTGFGGVGEAPLSNAHFAFGKGRGARGAFNYATDNIREAVQYFEDKVGQGENTALYATTPTKAAGGIMDWQLAIDQQVPAVAKKLDALRRNASLPEVSRVAAASEEIRGQMGEGVNGLVARALSEKNAGLERAAITIEQAKAVLNDPAARAGELYNALVDGLTAERQIQWAESEYLSRKVEDGGIAERAMLQKRVSDQFASQGIFGHTHLPVPKSGRLGKEISNQAFDYTGGLESTAQWVDQQSRGHLAASGPGIDVVRRYLKNAEGRYVVDPTFTSKIDSAIASKASKAIDATTLDATRLTEGEKVTFGNRLSRIKDIVRGALVDDTTTPEMAKNLQDIDANATDVLSQQPMEAAEQLVARASEAEGLTSLEKVKKFFEEVVKAKGDSQKLAVGGQLSGYGGGDTVPAMLEPGEYVMRKEAVRKYGAGLMGLLNGLRVEGSNFKSVVRGLRGFKDGGAVLAQPAILSPAGVYNLNLTIGGKSYPLMGEKMVIGALTERLRREGLTTK